MVGPVLILVALLASDGVEVQVVDGEIVSYDESSIVILVGDGRLLHAGLARVTELPEPLVSGAPVRVELVEGPSGLEALTVVLAPARSAR